MLHDLRQASRLLMRQRGFSLVASVMLAVGIGANTAVFSVLDAALFRSLPYRDPDQLVTIYTESRLRTGGTALVSTSGQALRFLRPLTSVFSGVSTYTHGRPVPISGGRGRPLQVAGIAPDLAGLLGAVPQLGRGLAPVDVGVGVVVISDDYWAHAFGRSPDIIGRRIAMAEHTYQIVGVMPPTFRYFVGGRIDAWEAIPDASGTEVVARIQANLTRLQAQAALDAALASPDMSWKPISVELASPEWNRGGKAASMMLLLLGAVGVLLIIACANVANMLLARTLTRRHEIAVRASLGATRGQLLRQLLFEGLTLAALGGTAAVGIAAILVRLIPSLVPRDLIPAVLGVMPPQLDWRALSVGVLATLLSGTACAIVPAIRASRAPSERGILTSGRRTGGWSREQLRLGRALQVVQIALTIVLLVGAGLLGTAFVRLAATPTRFDASQLVTVTVDLPKEWQQLEQRASLDELLRRIGSSPVTRGAALGPPPVFGSIGGTFMPEGLSSESDVPVEGFPVGAGYLTVIGIPILAGRDFSRADETGGRPVAIISQGLARRFWPDDSAVGRQFRRWESEEPRTIIGIAADVRTGGRVFNAEPVYELLSANAVLPTVTVRTTIEPREAVPLIVAAIRSVGTRLTPYRLSTVDDLFAELDPFGPPRFYALLMGLLSGLGVLTAAIGLFGMLTYAVNRRTHEIGVRLALGASPSHIRGAVLGQALVPVVAGMAVGLAMSLWLVRFLAAQVPSVHTSDPAAVAGALVGFLGATGVATIVPTRRALSVDPAVALRAE